MPAQEPPVSAREIFGVKNLKLVDGTVTLLQVEVESGRSGKDGTGVQR